MSSASHLTIDRKDVLALLHEASPGSLLVSISDDTDLWAVGALDSYSIVQMITLFEERFEIVFDFIHLNAANFRNVNSIFDLLITKYQLAEKISK